MGEQSFGTVEELFRSRKHLIYVREGSGGNIRDVVLWEGLTLGLNAIERRESWGLTGPQFRYELIMKP
jgi:hypothetical protein